MRHFLVFKFFVREKNNLIASLNFYRTTNIKKTIARENKFVVNPRPLYIAGINNTCKQKVPRTPKELEQRKVLCHLLEIFCQTHACSSRREVHFETTCFLANPGIATFVRSYRISLLNTSLFKSSTKSSQNRQLLRPLRSRSVCPLV